MMMMIERDWKQTANMLIVIFYHKLISPIVLFACLEVCVCARVYELMQASRNLLQLSLLLSLVFLPVVIATYWPF